MPAHGGGIVGRDTPDTHPTPALSRQTCGGMVTGMATTKVTITLDDDQLAEVHTLVAVGHASSVSGFVKHAVGVALHDVAGWKNMLEGALQDTGGPLTKKERAWADTLLSSRPPARRARRTRAA